MRDKVNRRKLLSAIGPVGAGGDGHGETTSEVEAREREEGATDERRQDRRDGSDEEDEEVGAHAKGPKEVVKRVLVLILDCYHSIDPRLRSRPIAEPTATAGVAQFGDFRSFSRPTRWASYSSSISSHREIESVSRSRSLVNLARAVQTCRIGSGVAEMNVP